MTEYVVLHVAGLYTDVSEFFRYLNFYEDVGVGVGEGDVSQGLERLPYLLGRGDVNPHGGTRQRRLDVHPTCNQSRAISKHATWRERATCMQTKG